MHAAPQIRAGDRLPAIRLPAPSGDRTIDLWSGGRVATAAVIIHGCCARCADYIEALRAREQDVRDWNGRIVVVITGDASTDPATVRASAVVRPVVDADDRLRRAGIGTPAVVIADEWGEIHEVESAGAEHAFMAPDELVSWLRFLAIQCPECQGEAL